MVCAPDVRDGSAAPGSRESDASVGAEAGDEREITAVPARCRRRPGQLDAGPFAADIASFRLHLAAENKAAGTIRTYTDAARWFAAAHLLRDTDKTRWEQVDARDVRRWVAWLLGSYSGAYARQQYRSLQQFFRWLAAEDEIPDPMEAVRGGCVAAPVPAPFQPHLAGPRRSGGRPDGAERLVLPADAATLRRQRARRASAPPLRPRHDGLTPAGRPGSGRGSSPGLAACAEGRPGRR
jgi:hypothetical protein